MNVSGLITRYLERKHKGDIPLETRLKITRAISDRTLRSFEPRPKDQRVHVSDIANGCPRAMWHRINYGLRSEFDSNTRKKMEYGHRYEDTLLAALIDAGYEPVTDTVIDWNNVVGHPDFEVFLNKKLHLISAKTSMFFYPVKPKTIEEIRTKQTQYILQDAFYSRALDAKAFTVNLSDRGTGMDTDYQFVTDEEWPATKERCDMMLAAANSTTEPEATPPAWTRDAKGVSYLCKRACPVTSCRNNANHIPIRNWNTK